MLFTDPGLRQKVEAAWKLLKARELAKKEAEQVAAKARETKGDPQVLRDLGAKLKKEIIEPILPLAHLTRQKQAMFTGGAAYARDQLPKEIQDKITYPRLREMGGEILKL